MKSNALNCRSKNVGVKAVIVAELKFRDVQRHVLGADLVERADNASLEDAPKALNRLSVNRADNILMFCVVNRRMRIRLVETLVADPLVGAEQANLLRHGLVNEGDQRGGADVINNAGDHVALAADSASNNRLAGSGRTGLAVALNPVTVLGFAADECFVNFDDAAKLGFRFDQRRTDFVAHGMRRPVVAEAHDALNLEGANPLLACQHQMGDAEPVAERFVRVLKDGARNVREAIASVRSALVALPLEGHGADRKHFGVAAARADHAIRPTACDQVSLASFLIGKRRFELSDSHLVNWSRFAGHLASPVYGGQYGM